MKFICERENWKAAAHEQNQASLFVNPTNTQPASGCQSPEQKPFSTNALQPGHCTPPSMLHALSEDGGINE